MKRQKEYRLIIFDFDGTIVDTLPDIARYAAQVLDELGVPAPPIQTVQRAVGRGVHELLRDLVPAFAADRAGLERAVARFKALYAAAPVVESKPYIGAPEALRDRLSSVKKAIVTNKPRDLTIAILKQLRLEEYFLEVLGLGPEFPPKPDPTSTLEVIRRLGETPGSTVYVGDSRVDAETSLRAGIDFAWVNYGYDGIEGYDPTYRLGSSGEWASLA